MKSLALGVVVALATVALSRLGGFDALAARDALVRTKSIVWLALVPFALLVLVDATAWALALGVTPRPAMLGRLVQSRLGLEAVSLTESASPPSRSNSVVLRIGVVVLLAALTVLALLLCAEPLVDLVCR